jgi:hypothetical protein
LPAADRRIDAQQFLVAPFDRDLAGDSRRDGGVVDKNPAPPQCLESAAGPQHDIGQIVVVAHAGDHHIGALGRFGRAGGDPAGKPGMRSHPCLRARSGAVVHGQAVSGLAQMAGHLRAHDAKAKKRNVEWFGHGRGV